MKKQWENPELNGLGVNETNEGGTIAKYEVISTADVEGKMRWKCLGVFDIYTGATISTCGLEFDTFELWAAHAASVHVGSLLQGQGNGYTPIS